MIDFEVVLWFNRKIIASFGSNLRILWAP